MNRTLPCALLAWLGAASLGLAQNAKPATDTKPPAKVPAEKKAKPEKANYPQAPIADYYHVEEVTMPPNLSAETGGLDCLPDGQLAACFHRGEVYIYNPAKRQWRLFADGLHDPLGIHAVNDHEMIVMQRPELTRIRDTDGDGVADDYETITDGFGMSGNYHEFGYGPVLDKGGNYYISLNVASNGAGIRYELRGEQNRYNPINTRMYSPVPWRGWVMKVTPKGELLPFAPGFRSPNGLGFDAEGHLLVPDNQGDWLGTSPVYHVEEGKFYGHPASLAWREGENRETNKIPIPELEKMRTRGAVLFPQGILANSPTQPLLDSTRGKFGPFAGQMLIGDYTHSYVMRMMLEKVDGQLQGAAAPLLERTGMTGGMNRLAFSPDGSLWVGHTSHGWGGSAGISHVTWTGKTPLDILEMHLTKSGFKLVFTKPLKEAEAILPSAYKLKRYRYEYGPAYGSPQRNIEDVPVMSATLAPDRKSVTLDLGELVAWRIYEMHLNGLRSDEGELPLNTMYFYTLNHLLENTPPPPVSEQKPSSTGAEGKPSAD